MRRCKSQLGRALVRIIIVGPAIALMAGAAPAHDPADVARAFDLIVFRSEYRAEVQQRLNRWNGPLRFYLESRAGDRALHHRLVEEHLRELRALTSLPMSIVEARGEANVLVLFERESRLAGLADELFPDAAEIKRIMASSVCLGRYYTNRRYEITSAVVIIPPDRAASRGLLLACVVEELTQVLGLPNDSAEVFPSIFNDRSIDTELTELDRALIRLLYHPRLRPGMDRHEALRIVEVLARDAHRH